MNKKNGESNQKAEVPFNESVYWFLVGISTLMMLLSNFASVFGIPSWVFIAVILSLIMIIAAQSQRQPYLFSTSNRLRVVVYAVLALVLIEAIWLGFIRQAWFLFAVWLPVTLLIGLFLYLFIAVVIEKTMPSLYLLIPVAGFLVGGLLWLVWSDFGYLNLSLLSFTLLSLATGLWLRYRSKNNRERIG